MREHHSSIHAFDLALSPGEPSASDSPLSAAPSVPAAARADPCTFVRLSPSVLSSMSTLARTVRSLASHLHQH